MPNRYVLQVSLVTTNQESNTIQSDKEILSMDDIIVTKNPDRNLKIISLIVLSFVSIALVVNVTPAKAQSNQEKYDRILRDWKTAAKAASVAGGKFSVAEREESNVLRDEWRNAVDEGNRQMKLLVPVAIELFNELETPPQELTDLMIRITESEFVKGRYETAFELSGLILEADPPSDEDPNLNPGTERVLVVRMASAAMSNQFSVAKEIKEGHPYLLDKLDREASLLFAEIDSLIEQYETEIAIQEKEAEADDLPRVKIKTSKGTIVVELFENEAPDTVGNFIDLVENGWYQDVFFHRVINHFMAQTGAMNGRGQRLDVGYTIYDECGKLDARMHFRGSLSMAKTGEPDTGSAQFFFNFVPTPFLNQRHTVFGRIISGMDVLERIGRTHEIAENGEEKVIESAVSARPDTIISATVVRKRDHEYKPNRVEQ